MKIPFFSLFKQHEELSQELNEAFSRVVRQGQFILGDEVLAFESSFAGYLGAGHCIACGNGTDALELAFEALGIGTGDEVIVPAFGWHSCYLALKRLGATPVVVDVGQDMNLDSGLIPRFISKSTKAVVAIHLFGLPCDILALKQVCEAHGLLLIEDCAQAHGAEVAGSRVGAHGDVGVFSFYPTKNLGAMGDGGAVTCRDLQMAERIKQLRDYGRPAMQEGRNSRLDELQAAFLNVKLKYLDAWNERRRANAKSYALGIGDAYSASSVYHQYVLRVKDRDLFRARMDQVGIGTSVHYPFHLSTDEGSHAARLSREVVSLPVFPELTDIEISYICEHLNRLQGFLI